MTFVTKGRPRLGDLTDFVEAGGWTNPDGSPTYDGAPYGDTDPFNPFNFYLPVSAPAPTSAFINPDGTPTYNQSPYSPYDDANPFNKKLDSMSLVPTVQASPSTVTSTGLPPSTAPTSPTSFTGIIQSLAAAFAPKATPPLSSPLYANKSAVSTLPVVPTGGISTGTLLVVGGGILVALMLSNRRAS